MLAGSGHRVRGGTFILNIPFAASLDPLAKDDCHICTLLLLDEALPVSPRKVERSESNSPVALLPLPLSLQLEARQTGSLLELANISLIPM